MSYLDDVGQELTDMLKNDAMPIDKLVFYVQSKLKESYKNGAQAARKQQPKAQQPKPKQKSQAADYREA